MAKEITIAVLNQNGAETENKIELDGEIFGIEPNTQVMFDAVQVYRANMRQATAKTKNRAEVRGGGKKPWRQKGTGRARAGSNRSPIWVGGGTVFGPSGVQNFKLAQNKKSHALAIKSALSVKASENNIVVVDAFSVAKTKDFVASLASLKADGKTLVVLAEENEALLRASGNVRGVKVVLPDNVCVYDVLNADKLVFTADAVKAVEGGLK